MLGRESRVDWLVEIGDNARGRFGAKRAFRGQAETKRPRMRTVLIAVLCACVPWGALHAQSLEGQWTVLQVCEATQEGARGYTWRYSARVVDGQRLRPELAFALNGEVLPLALHDHIEASTEIAIVPALGGG